MRCDYCKKRIRRRAKKRHHVNICQVPPEGIFCTAECEEAYRKDKKNNNEKCVVTWKFEDQIDRVSFAREVEREYISDKKISHFSKELEYKDNKRLARMKKRLRANV